MATYFLADDGAGEPTIWRELPDGKGPAPVARRVEMPHPWGDLLWSVLVGVLTADDETVERVARALYRRTTFGPLDPHMPSDDSWDERSPAKQDVFRSDAITALAALARGGR